MAGIPVSVETEKLVLGSILMDDSLYEQVYLYLLLEDFSLDIHRTIFCRMSDLHSRGDAIDRVTLANELLRHAELERCGGVSYLVSLDEGLPHFPSIESYVRILKDLSDLRKIIHTANSAITRAMRGEEHASSIWDDFQKHMVDMGNARDKFSPLTPAEIITSMGGLSAYLDRSTWFRGVRSGYRAFDELANGFEPGKFYVIAARPRMGKTAFVLNVAERVSVDKDNVTLIFSLEMDRKSLIDRMICSRARVNTKRFESGVLSPDESKRITKSAGDIVGCDRIKIDDKAVTSMEEIHSKIRREKQRGGVGLVIIDYLQLLIKGDDRHRVAEASRISRDMKIISKDCDVPILTLSQLNRECDSRSDHRPQLNDLRDTGAIEQDADLVGFLYRQEVYNPDREDFKGLADLIVAKQRSGPEGVVPLVWLKHTVRFEERAEERASAAA